ncbi:MAG: UDP-N-acetyl-D-mannosamine dehydrogenase [Dehalococcoidia bacterium]|nr:UDP-N-acetyl-D-mannosamine dehydrogenase [Dehalococcoidia bacterium]|tara:strand:- start:1933 stop:3147 length:1215 start_codon:yes stop_codon:yes gene_type:complete
MNKFDKSVSVIGLGYIGLPTAALLSHKGYMVKGYDLNENAVNTINNGMVHIVEPELENYVSASVKSGNLKAFSELQPAEIYIICVPTPFELNTNLPDLSYVFDAAKQISKLIKKGDLVILESTSPVGTTNKVYEIFREEGIDTSSIFLSYCPERVLPGRIMVELVTNDRIIGGINSISTDKAADFYSTFVDGDIKKTDSKTAEMCKLTENSFRDVNIAFANELSLICENEGINVWDLIKLANLHPRVDILQPGTGVGGHCIAVDPWFIVANDPENSLIIKTARLVNNQKPKWIVSKVAEAINNENFLNPKIACLGLAFKPNIDDLRESPAIEVYEQLSKKYERVFAVEPNIDSNFKDFVIYSLEDAIKESDIVVILVKHKEFLSPDVRMMLKKKMIFDFCGAFQ